MSGAPKDSDLSKDAGWHKLWNTLLSLNRRAKKTGTEALSGASSPVVEQDTRKARDIGANAERELELVNLSPAMKDAIHEYIRELLFSMTGIQRFVIKSKKHDDVGCLFVIFENLVNVLKTSCELLGLEAESPAGAATDTEEYRTEHDGMQTSLEEINKQETILGRSQTGRVFFWWKRHWQRQLSKERGTEAQTRSALMEELSVGGAAPADASTALLEFLQRKFRYDRHVTELLHIWVHIYPQDSHKFQVQPADADLLKKWLAFVCECIETVVSIAVEHLFLYGWLRLAANSIKKADERQHTYQQLNSILGYSASFIDSHGLGHVAPASRQLSEVSKPAPSSAEALSVKDLAQTLHHVAKNLSALGSHHAREKHGWSRPEQEDLGGYDYAGVYGGKGKH